jgi:L-ribulokinase
MTRTDRIALGLDFGTESVRALLVDCAGHERAAATAKYRHGQITERLPGTDEPLGADWALQAPGDWMNSAARASKQAIKRAGIDAADVIGVGVDFTSCTMLPCAEDGTPLCELEAFADRPHAWPKLWKHHGAKAQTDRINELARRTKQSWLARYGGIVGLEWLLPKMLEALEDDGEAYRAAEYWMEAGDWFVWRLTGEPAPVRSTCQAGYKACWDAGKAEGRDRGYPPRSFLKKLHPALADAATTKLRGEHHAPGMAAGALTAASARRLGLRAGTPVSAAIIDAHAGVPGAGVSGADTLVMVLGTSSCHMLMSRAEKMIPGVAGIVRDGILPGYTGYETGQAAVGDAFAWLARTVHRSFAELDAAARELEAGSGGVMALDWMNGCRTPLMDGSLKGAFTGLTLGSSPAQMHRALIEATGFGLRWIVELFEEAAIPVKRCVATGGLPRHNPLLVRIYADILGRPIAVHPSSQGPALGAAILGAMAAGRAKSGFRSASAAVKAMATPKQPLEVVRPGRKDARTYDGVYEDYRALAEAMSR